MDLAETRPTVRRGDDRWWVLTDVPLNLGRELIELADGLGYLRHSDRLLPDPGWGPPPQPGRQGEFAVTELAARPVLDLIRAAGLSTRPAALREQIVALVPTARAHTLLRRALDLRLDATFRPVRLRPLFGPQQAPGALPAPGDALAEQSAGTLIELRLAAAGHNGPQNRHIPETLISVLDNDPVVLPCREVSSQLLIQYDRHSPLTDRQLDALVDHDAWVLADPPHGCWSLSPLADFAPAGSLVRLSPSHQLGMGDVAWPDRGQTSPFPPPADLTIVRAGDDGSPIDALLLDDDDLANLAPLLEGRPLAEFAALVPGRDRHLLVASGGIIERIPLGEYLSCIGPGPIYLPHGWRTAPRLPAPVWRQLTKITPGTALVLERDRTLAFDLNLRRPVWELWAGELPPFDPQLPPEASQALARIEAQLEVQAPRVTAPVDGPPDESSDAGAHPEPPRLAAPDGPSSAFRPGRTSPPAHLAGAGDGSRGCR